MGGSFNLTELALHLCHVRPAPTAAPATVEPEPVKPQPTPLLMLPPEIIHQILAWLPCHSLVSLARVCRHLRDAAAEDLLWQSLLRPNIPACDFPDNPFPSNTYRDLYITHHPYWFVPRNKIWISNDPYVGRVMLCKFDPRRGCIEGYRLLAERGPSQTIVWPHLPGVVIHTFNPSVRLWLDDPVLKLPHDPATFSSKLGWWEGEIRMLLGRPGYNTSASFFLSRDIPDDAVHPSMDVWPPPTIPNMPRVRASSGDKFRARAHKPQRCEEISQTTFRMRHWSQFASGMSTYGVRIGEEVTTWSTIDPVLYMPTKEKPYQGIFVGDYAGHGCEFLLIMQTDEAASVPQRSDLRHHTHDEQHVPFSHQQQHTDTQPNANVHTPPSPSSMPRASMLTDLPANSAIYDDPSIFHGAIKAVKLTGDPNVPRGQYSFIAEDIGPAGFIRTATEKPFVGARVVQSHGHVAARGFVHGEPEAVAPSLARVLLLTCGPLDEFIVSQLLLISHDRMAQYWVPYGHVSFYRRVDIDDLMRTTFST
ncbi:hypothetical protein DV738_g3547, partial [Chaetothyriales sp. CBS 135597]